MSRSPVLLTKTSTSRRRSSCSPRRARPTQQAATRMVAALGLHEHIIHWLEIPPPPPPPPPRSYHLALCRAGPSHRQRRDPPGRHPKRAARCTRLCFSIRASGLRRFQLDSRESDDRPLSPRLSVPASSRAAWPAPLVVLVVVGAKVVDVSLGVQVGAGGRRPSRRRGPSEHRSRWRRARRQRHLCGANRTRELAAPLGNHRPRARQAPPAGRRERARRLNRTLSLSCLSSSSSLSLARSLLLLLLAPSAGTARPPRSRSPTAA